MAAIGEGWCFLLNAVSYVAVIAGLLAMRFPALPPPAEGGSQARRLLEGLAMVRRTVPIRSLLLLVGMISLLGTPHQVLLPIFAAEVFHGSSRTFGLLSAVSGVGALAGALTLAMRPSHHGLGRWIAGMALGFGLAVTLFAASRVVALSALLLMVGGFCWMVQLSATNTLIQMMVPDAYRGRVMSLHAMMFLGMSPLGGLLAGMAAHHLGAPWTVALGGLGSAACALAFILHYHRWRDGARDLMRAAEAEAR